MKLEIFKNNVDDKDDDTFSLVFMTKEINLCFDRSRSELYEIAGKIWPLRLKKKENVARIESN